jgi:hypothetical protein
LLQQRKHALAELGKLGGGALAAKQVAAELALELFDGARQLRLGHVALVGSTREVQRACHRQEVADLVHLHDQSLDQILPA